MNSATAPRPLRLLLAWPDPPAREVRRVLRRQGDALEVDYVAPAGARQHLVGTAYFHMLLFGTAEWRGLEPAERQRYAQRAALVVLGPEPADPSDLTQVRSAVYFAQLATPTEATTCLATLCEHLSQGWPLGRSVAESNDRLLLLGSEACWPEATAHPAPAARSTPGQPAPHGGPPTGSVAIGEMNVAGDAVFGNKIVYQATGDQAIHSGLPAVKVVQQAGRDQVNINRMGGESGIDIHQAANGDQVNLNSRSEAAGRPEKLCPQCGSVPEAESKFCGRCGLPL